MVIRGDDGVRVQSVHGLAMRADAANVGFGEAPGIRYLGYARWYPYGNSAASLENLLPTLIANVRPEMEQAEGIDCWVIDTFDANGVLDDTYWIAPSRAWMPVRWVNWSNGEALDEMRVTAWHDLGEGRFLPAAGRTDHFDGGEWGELLVPQLGPNEQAVTLAPTENDLPAQVASIVPAGIALWNRSETEQASVPSPVNAADTAVAMISKQSKFVWSGFGVVVMMSAAVAGWFAADWTSKSHRSFPKG